MFHSEITRSAQLVATGLTLTFLANNEDNLEFSIFHQKLQLKTAIKILTSDFTQATSISFICFLNVGAVSWTNRNLSNDLI